MCATTLLLLLLLLFIGIGGRWCYFSLFVLCPPSLQRRRRHTVFRLESSEFPSANCKEFIEIRTISSETRDLPYTDPKDWSDDTLLVTKANNVMRAYNIHTCDWNLTGSLTSIRSTSPAPAAGMKTQNKQFSTCSFNCTYAIIVWILECANLQWIYDCAWKVPSKWCADDCPSNNQKSH